MHSERRNDGTSPLALLAASLDSQRASIASRECLRRDKVQCCCNDAPLHSCGDAAAATRLLRSDSRCLWLVPGDALTLLQGSFGYTHISVW